MTRRVAAFREFATAHVPAPPARVLEIGCGDGELARSLAAGGFDVTAIDPNAPQGRIFERVRLEEFRDERPFDAVVASVSLHHIEDLAGALDKVVSLLRPSGVLVLEEFAKERLTGATARWYYQQRGALAAAGRVDSAVSGDFESWARESNSAHAEIHPAEAIRAELETRFAERFFERTPYLYSWRLDDALELLERRLIEEGAIEATGFWYAGERL